MVVNEDYGEDQMAEEDIEVTTEAVAEEEVCAVLC